jgi:hypothetical protein
LLSGSSAAIFPLTGKMSALFFRDFPLQECIIVSFLTACKGLVLILRKM